MRYVASLTLLASLVSSAGADPGDKSGSPALADASALAAKGETLKAAARFGDAIAAAQSAGDLEAEDAAATALDAFFAALPADAAPDAKTVAPTRAAVLAATMRKLDANRAGAFVSASVLARNVLQLATESGDLTVVADAARIAAKSTPGAAKAVVARYAEGLKAVTEGRVDAAAAALEKSAADAAKAHWFELSMHASTELCALWLAQAAPDKAAAAIAAAAARIDDSCGSPVAENWLAATKRRCAAAPEIFTKPIEELLDRVKKGGRSGSSASAAGERRDPMSKIGNVLPTLSKDKPFVAATRRPDGFEIAWTTNATDKPLVPFPGGRSETSDGGVTVGMFGRSVTLARVVLAGTALGGSGGGAASPVRAYYLIAEGETWGVTENGVVTISR